MTNIQWKAAYNTGISEIDSQHQQLVGYLNDLHRAILDNNQKAIAMVIEELIDYTQTHFVYEEELMASFDYEFFSAHQRVHELFTARIMRYKRRFDKGEDIATDLFNLLRRWLLNHISHDDQSYAAAYIEIKKTHVKKNTTAWARFWHGLKQRFFRESP